MTPETLTIPTRAAYWIRLPTHNVRVYLATVAPVPAYGDVFARGLDWPSLASAVTALEVDAWREIAPPQADAAAREKTA